MNVRSTTADGFSRGISIPVNTRSDSTRFVVILASVAVMIAGLYFHTASLTSTRYDYEESSAQGENELFTLVMFIGPFVESAVGFGVGILVVMNGLSRFAIPPLAAALLSLLSQTLVPWGGFAVGTLIGSQIAGMSLNEIALISALLSVPLMLGWLHP